ncbi:MAG: hypothetical protein ACK5LO_13610 [Leucobacter sp.]
MSQTEMDTRQPNRRERRKRNRFRKATVIALAAGLILGTGTAMGGAVFPATQAHAVSLGAGVWFGGDVGAGSFIHSNGTIVYCAELGKATVMGDNPAMGATSSLPAYNVGSYMVAGQTFTNVGTGALSGEGLRQFNYILSHYGSTNNNAQAGAVQIALWKLRASGSTAGYQQALAFMESGVGGGVVSQANAMISEAANANEAVGAPSDPRIRPGATPYTGTVVVDPGTTELTITNGIFTSTGTNRITFSGGTTSVTNVPFVGQAPYDAESWDRYYRVTVNGKYSYTEPGSGVLYGSPGGLGQGLAHAAPAVTRSGDYDAVYIDPDTVWSPVLSTQVPSKFVQDGEQFSDTVTFDVAEGSDPWRIGITSGGETRYAPITAKGTLYGPFLADPADNPSGTPPRNAPVAATAEITTDTTREPGTYEVTAGTSREAGYYTWVWNIEFDDQANSVTNPTRNDPSIPVDYFFTDGFGQIGEGQITPSDISFTTQLSDTEVAIGGKFTDDITVSLNKGGWLQTNGARTEFTLRGTVYTTDEQPEKQKNAPEGAEVLTTTTTTINGPDETFTSDEIQIPYTSTDNWVTVQWCLLDEDQTDDARGKAKEYCDDWGVPSESAEILRPEVTTQAQPDGAYKGDIKDTALVEGTVVPDVPNEIDFTYYLQPKAGDPKYDENWEPVLDDAGEPVLWTAEEVSDPDAVCLAQPVAKTERVEVTQIGSVDSPPVHANSVGTGYWVERYYITTPEDEEIVIHEGKCGLENEKTVIDYPKVRTESAGTVKVGEDMFDSAIVSGEFAPRDRGVEYKVTFKAYERTAGEQMVCSPENELKDFEDKTGVKVDKPGRYDSKKVKTKEKHVGLGGYVETLWLIEDGKEKEIHVGKCGEKSENFEIKKPTPVDKAIELAVTGGNGLGLMSAAALLLLGGGGAALYAQRRKQLALVDDNAEGGEGIEALLKN